MHVYCLRCKKQTESKNTANVITKNGKNMISGICSVCGTKTNKFTNTPVSGKGIFNTILNKLPLPEMHLSHPTGEKVSNGSFNHKQTYSYCGPFTKVPERLKEGYQGTNSLDAACRDHDIAYYKYSDTTTRNKFDDILANRANHVANSSSEQKEIKDARLVEAVMAAKSRFGMGRQRKCDRQKV